MLHTFWSSRDREVVALGSLSKLYFVDKNGKPLGEHIDAVIRGLIPRLRQTFPLLKDEAVITNLAEQAAQQFCEYESRNGPPDNAHRLAWTILWRLTSSWVRRSQSRVDSHSVAIAPLLSSNGLAATTGSPEQIERSILLQELQNLLSPRERAIYALKMHGFSSREVGRQLNLTESNVDTIFCRTRQILLELFNRRAGKRD